MNFELDYEKLKILLKNFIVEVTVRILVLILKTNDASSDLKKQIYDVFDELATSLQQEDVFTDEELEELLVTFGKETREQDTTPATYLMSLILRIYVFILFVYTISWIKCLGFYFLIRSLSFFRLSIPNSSNFAVQEFCVSIFLSDFLNIFSDQLSSHIFLGLVH